jgi:hypothetical protein
MASTTIDHLIINSPYSEPTSYWSYDRKNRNFVETKGQDTDRDKTKKTFLDEWVKAVDEHGGFGKWNWAGV